MLVCLGITGDGPQALAGADIAEGEADEFGAALRGAEAEQEHSVGLGSDWRGRGGGAEDIMQNTLGTAGAADLPW